MRSLEISPDRETEPYDYWIDTEHTTILPYQDRTYCM
jgi:hypothetical protein